MTPLFLLADRFLLFLLLFYLRFFVVPLRIFTNVRVCGDIIKVRFFYFFLFILEIFYVQKVLYLELFEVAATCY